MKIEDMKLALHLYEKVVMIDKRLMQETVGLIFNSVGDEPTISADVRAKILQLARTDYESQKAELLAKLAAI